MCPLCAADPQPENFGSPRKCAFTATGEFTPENWNCASIEMLLDHERSEDCCVYGDDESFEHTYVDERPFEGEGWIITSRYKRRGRTSSAIWVGDFFPPRPVTLGLVVRALDARLARLNAKNNGQ